MKTKAECANENLDKFMRDGPRLSSGYNTWIEARSPNTGHVLLGGLGGMGVGIMWVKENERHKKYPGYEDAPLAQYKGDSLG